MGLWDSIKSKTSSAVSRVKSAVQPGLSKAKSAASKAASKAVSNVKKAVSKVVQKKPTTPSRSTKPSSSTKTKKPSSSLKSSSSKTPTKKAPTFTRSVAPKSGVKYVPPPKKPPTNTSTKIDMSKNPDKQLIETKNKSTIFTQMTAFVSDPFSKVKTMLENAPAFWEEKKPDFKLPELPRFEIPEFLKFKEPGPGEKKEGFLGLGIGARIEDEKDKFLEMLPEWPELPAFKLPELPDFSDMFTGLKTSVSGLFSGLFGVATKAKEDYDRKKLIRNIILSIIAIFVGALMWKKVK